MRNKSRRLLREVRENMMFRTRAQPKKTYKRKPKHRSKHAQQN